MTNFEFDSNLWRSGVDFKIETFLNVNLQDKHTSIHYT